MIPLIFVDVSTPKAVGSTLISICSYSFQDFSIQFMHSSYSFYTNFYKNLPQIFPDQWLIIEY